MERVTLVAEGSMLLGSKGHLLHKVTAPRSGDVTNLISIKKKKKKPQRSGKMRRQKNTFQMKEKTKYKKND